MIARVLVLAVTIAAPSSTRRPVSYRVLDRVAWHEAVEQWQFEEAERLVATDERYHMPSAEWRKLMQSLLANAFVRPYGPGFQWLDLGERQDAAVADLLAQQLNQAGADGFLWSPVAAPNVQRKLPFYAHRADPAEPVDLWTMSDVLTRRD